MPTEDEMEQIVNDHIDRERAAIQDVHLAGLDKGKKRESDD